MWMSLEAWSHGQAFDDSLRIHWIESTEFKAKIYSFERIIQIIANTLQAFRQFKVWTSNTRTMASPNFDKFKL